MNGQMSAFGAPDEYKKRLEQQLLDDEQRLSLAVAFWGEGAVELVSSRPGKDFRLLCNLKSGDRTPTSSENSASSPRVERAAAIAIRSTSQALDDLVKFYRNDWLHAYIRMRACCNFSEMIGLVN